MTRPRLIALWLAGVLALTLFPFGPLTPSAKPFAWALPSDPSLLLFDLLANFAFFLPLGVLAGGRAAVMAGLLLSLAIETTQAHLPMRTPSAIDVLANTLGTLAGAALREPLLRGVRLFATPPLRPLLLLLLPATLHFVPQLERVAPVLPFCGAILGGLGGGTLPVALLAGILVAVQLGDAGGPDLLAAALAGTLLYRASRGGAWAAVTPRPGRVPSSAGPRAAGRGRRLLAPRT